MPLAGQMQAASSWPIRHDSLAFLTIAQADRTGAAEACDLSHQPDGGYEIIFACQASCNGLVMSLERPDVQELQKLVMVGSGQIQPIRLSLIWQ